MTQIKLLSRSSGTELCALSNGHCWKMASIKNIKTVTLGQTRSRVSTRLYTWQWHQNIVCKTELFASVMMQSKVKGIIWMFLDVEKPSLGFAQVLLEYTALALQTAQVFGIMSSICMLSSGQRHSSTFYLN